MFEEFVIHDDVPNLYFEYKAPINGVILPIFRAEVTSREKAMEVLEELKCEELFDETGLYSISVYLQHYTEREDDCMPELQYTYYKPPANVAVVFWDLAMF